MDLFFNKRFFVDSGLTLLISNFFGIATDVRFLAVKGLVLKNGSSDCANKFFLGSRSKILTAELSLNFLLSSKGTRVSAELIYL